MKKYVLVVISLWVFNYLHAQEVPTEVKSDFDSVALAQKVFDLDGKESSVGDVLSKYKGSIIFVDLWASWCPDCIKGIPKLKEVQQEYPDLVYLFLSLDRKESNWKKAIEKYDLKGDHFWFQTDWKNDFTDYVGLNWIPRYMLIDREGKIAHYYAIHADDPQLLETLVELNLLPKN